MNRYKVINLKTNEEHLCDKVTIDGFDYYATKFINKVNTYINEYGKPIVKYKKDLNDDLIWESLNGKSSACDSKYEFKTIVATNNPNIDIPKVIDEIEKLCKFNVEKIYSKYIPKDLLEDYTLLYELGYKKSQQTHSFSEEDMIEFSEWKFKNLFFVVQDLSNGIQWKSNNKLYNKIYKTKELIQLWKEQQIKTIYYE